MMLSEVRLGLGLQNGETGILDAVLHTRWWDLYQQADA